MNLLSHDFNGIIKKVDKAFKNHPEIRNYRGLKSLMTGYSTCFTFEYFPETRSRYDNPLTYYHTIYIYDSVNTSEKPCENCGLPYSYTRPQRSPKYSIGKVCSFCRLVFHQYASENRVWVEIRKESVYGSFGNISNKALDGDAYAFWKVNKEEEEEGYLQNYDQIVEFKDQKPILELIRKVIEIDKFQMNASDNDKVILIKNPFVDREEKLLAFQSITSIEHLLELYEVMGGTITYYSQFRKIGLSDREIFDLFKESIGKEFAIGIKKWTPSLLNSFAQFIKDDYVRIDLSLLYRYTEGLMNHVFRIISGEEVIFKAVTLNLDKFITARNTSLNRHNSFYDLACKRIAEITDQEMVKHLISIGIFEAKVSLDDHAKCCDNPRPTFNNDRLICRVCYNWEIWDEP